MVKYRSSRLIWCIILKDWCPNYRETINYFLFVIFISLRSGYFRLKRHCGASSLWLVGLALKIRGHKRKRAPSRGNGRLFCQNCETLNSSFVQRTQMTDKLGNQAQSNISELLEYTLPYLSLCTLLQL